MSDSDATCPLCHAQVDGGTLYSEDDGGEQIRCPECGELSDSYDWFLADAGG